MMGAARAGFPVSKSTENAIGNIYGTPSLAFNSLSSSQPSSLFLVIVTCHLSFDI
jgi:hypothetical protein